MAEWGERDAGRSQGPLGIGGAIDAYMGSIASQETVTHRAMALWCRAVGQTGARHTRGVFLRESAGGLPTLIVYLDSSPLIYEYTTDMGLYRDRLAILGMGVASLEFRLSRYTGQSAQVAQVGQAGHTAQGGHAAQAAQAAQGSRSARGSEPSRTSPSAGVEPSPRERAATQTAGGCEGRSLGVDGDDGSRTGAGTGPGEVDERLVEGLPEPLARAILGAMRASENS